MSSDVFIISAARDASAPTAIGQAIQLAGVSPSHAQDAVFGLDGISDVPDVASLAEAAGLTCPTACVSTGMRAVFFAAASMLSDDAALSVAIGLSTASSAAFVLASPEAVGRINLMPRARIAARSLAGPEPALKIAGLQSTDVEISREGTQGLQSLYELLEEMDTKAARWGMLAAEKLVILIERV